MEERFFGPWHIELVRVVNIFQSRFVINGSSGTDGAYELDPGQPLSLSVEGKEWTLGIESAWFDTGFTARPVRRSNIFDRLEGLIAVMEMGRPPGNVIGPLHEYVQLRCISQDPAVNPAPETHGFDFTIPEH